MDLCPIAVLRESYGLNVEVDGVVHLRRVPCMCFISKQPEDSDFLEPLPFSPRQKLQWATYQNKARLDVKQLLEVCQVSPGLFLFASACFMIGSAPVPYTITLVIF
jgi:hypothetical protein